MHRRPLYDEAQVEWSSWSIVGVTSCVRTPCDMKGVGIIRFNVPPSVLSHCSVLCTPLILPRPIRTLHLQSGGALPKEHRLESNACYDRLGPCNPTCPRLECPTCHQSTGYCRQTTRECHGSAAVQMTKEVFPNPDQPASRLEVYK